MNRTHLAMSVLLAALWACDDKPAGGAAPSASSAAASPSASTAATTPSASASTTTAATPPSASASAAPSSDASSAPSGASSGAPSPSGSASSGAKKYDCGGKGEKPCPMQGWMKGVMTRAVADADGEKLAAALNTVASKPPPGFGEWSAIAAAGAAKAKGGDIDGAKEACKKCHSLYQKTYKETMRDRPW